jgi:hypothetical protein
LKAGMVPILIDYASRNCTGIDLTWVVPGEAAATIPYTNLFPEK